MASTEQRLSSKSARVLSLIAEGHTYEQIVAGMPEITYKDIFEAAAEALRVCEEPGREYREHLAGIRQECPRAYEPWTEGEDEKSKMLHEQGVSARIIAQELQRQPSAIRSRLRKQGLAR